MAEEFTRRLAGRMGRLKVGRGTEEGVEVGPLIDGDQRDKVVELVEDAVGKGARYALEGGALDGRGYFYRPSVLADARLLKEEIFGPVAPVATFAGEDEAVAAANDTEFGLVAYVYTRDVGRAFRVAEELETGMVGLNRGLVSNPAAPFGGVKHSGIGREGGAEGIEEHSRSSTWPSRSTDASTLRRRKRVRSRSVSAAGSRSGRRSTARRALSAACSSTC